MDKTCKLLDITAQKCRQTLRGHTDSVNHVVFQPYTNHAVSCSGDKSVSMWDVRTALCLQTFFGHKGSCNHVIFNRKVFPFVHTVSYPFQGDTIASTDTTGIVKIWDVRMVAERLTLDAGPFPVNRGVFDNSGQYFIVGTDEALIKVFDIEQKKLVAELSGHKGPVHSVSLDLNGQTLLSAGRDGLVRVWS